MTFELEIPAIVLDRVVLDESALTPVVTNRNPEPAEERVPLSTVVSLDITDVGTNGLDLAALQVDINGVTAYDGGAGGFQSGFQGPQSISQSPDPDTARLVIDPDIDFSSLQVVSVKVRAATTLTPIPEEVDSTYFFVCEDRTKPILVKGFMRELQRVRVTFNESMRQVDPTATDDILNPSNWTIVTKDTPAVSLRTVSIQSVSDKEVDLFLDRPASFRRRYEVQVENGKDLFDNVITEPDNTVEFLGYDCPRPNGRDFDIYGLFAQFNRDEDVTGDLKKFASILQDVFDLLFCEIDEFPRISSPNTAPEPVVDLMLNDLGNPFQFQELDLNEKRRLLKVLVPIYLLKGTAPGVRNAIRFFLGLEVDIRSPFGEGWIIEEEPVIDVSALNSGLGVDTVLFPSSRFNIYAFDVAVDQILTDDERKRIRFIVDFMKPSHTHFVNLIEPQSSPVFDHLELGISELGINWELHV